MKSIVVRALLGLSCCWMWVQATAAEPVLPPVIQAGLGLWSKGGPELALDAWQKGGLLESDTARFAAWMDFFRRHDRALGNYESSEIVATKGLGRTSQICYLSLNFERGAVYAKFVLYRSSKGWLVQNMDFHTRPEAIMPCLAIEEEKSAE